MTSFFLVRAAAISAAALTALWALAGCSDEVAPATNADPVRDAAQEARAAGFTEQYEILEDGQVTQAEYERAIDQTLSCMRQQGLDPSTAWLNPVDGRTLVFTLGTPQPLNGEVDCQEQYQSYVQGAYTSTTPARMDPSLLSSVTTCLLQRGLPSVGSAQNYGELVDAIGVSNELQLSECVVSGIQSLFPEQTLIQIGY